MPGPSNKKKRKPVQRNHKVSRSAKKPSSEPQREESGDTSSPSSRSPSRQPSTPPSGPRLEARKREQSKDWGDPCSYGYIHDKDGDQLSINEGFLPPKPYIYDPGNGPRVRDTRAFLSSIYFAQKPAMDIPLCAEFAQPEILEMLRTVLPEEMALILWYNKSRATSRICPACQRLYRLGDKLLDLIYEEPRIPAQHDSPYLQSEQEISGLCSPVCFILASFNYPSAIKQAWGRMVDEIDEQTWEIMNGPGDATATGELSKALGMLVKMTRLHDLGLDQLCFGQDLEDSDDLSTVDLYAEDDAVDLSSEFMERLTIAT